MPPTAILRDGEGREYRVELSGGTIAVDGVAVEAARTADGALHVRAPQNVTVWAAISGHLRWVFVDGRVFTFELEQPTRGRRRAAARHHGSSTAPMPATVRKVLVAPGSTVRRGDVLVILEAMKMELPVRATSEATITAVNCREGELVQAGQELVDLEEG
jgi:3-methylcrotonyl-CoA carboxylase alpha subunit